jgi:DNA-binding CsgD family transcriptional regulator
MQRLESVELRVVELGLLTKREAEVLLWMAEGKTAWEAAQILGVAEGTVRIHMANILGKLRASNKPHAVSRAFLAGIIGRKLAALLLLIASCMPQPSTQVARAPRPPITRTARAPTLARCRRDG